MALYFAYECCPVGARLKLLCPCYREAAPNLKLRFSIVGETLATLKLARNEGKGVWNSLLAISWFWFIGAVVLSQIPALGKDLLHGDTSVVTMLLAVFSIGVAIGSLLCERLSNHQVEIGLVPVGSIGLSVFTADLAFSASGFSSAITASGSTEALTWLQYLDLSGSVRVLIDIAMVGVFGGLFIVPLYAFVQLRSAPERQSQVISANNVLNAVFMVSAAGMSGVLLSAGMDVPGLILVCAVLNALVALYIYRTVPEFLWRFVSWVIVHSIYRVKTTGHENVPEQGLP